jgi:hypothetical protein
VLYSKNEQVLKYTLPHSVKDGVQKKAHPQFCFCAGVMAPLEHSFLAKNVATMLSGFDVLRLECDGGEELDEALAA